MNNERRQHIDEFFRKEMGDHTETPPAAVWNALEQRLDGNTGRKSRRFPLWWFWAIGGLMVASIGVMIANQVIKDNGKVINVVSNPTIQPAQNNVSANTVTKQEEQLQLTDNNHETEINKNKQTYIASNAETLTQNKRVIARATADEHAQPEKETNTAGQSSLRKTEQLSLLTSIPAQQLQQKIDDIQPMHKDIPQLPHQQDELSALNTITAKNIATSTYNHIPTPASIIATPRQQDKLSELYKKDNDNLVKGSIASIERIGMSLPTYDVPPADATAAVHTTTLEPIHALVLDESDNSRQDNILHASSAIDNNTPADTSRKKKFIKPEEDVITNKDIAESVKDKSIIEEKKKINLSLEAGIKGGFSKGTNNNWRADKYVIAPYIACNYSQLSLIFQPAYATGKPRYGSIQAGTEMYHDVKGYSTDSNSRIVRGVIDSSILTPNPPDTIYRNYVYGQTYDSITVNYGIVQSRMWDVELPLILKYNITNRFAIFAGGSVTISSVLQTREEVKRYSGGSNSITEEATPQTFFVTTPGQQPPTGAGAVNPSTMFNAFSDPFSNYQPRPGSTSTTKNFTRYGFMVGASATIKDRFMIDVMIHKSGVDNKIIAEKDIQKIYTQPYIRVMLGYKLWK